MALVSEHDTLQNANLQANYIVDPIRLVLDIQPILMIELTPHPTLLDTIDKDFDQVASFTPISDIDRITGRDIHNYQAILRILSVLRAARSPIRRPRKKIRDDPGDATLQRI